MQRIFITGARAKTGAPLARLLAGRDAEVLGGTTAPERLDGHGIQPIRFDWTDESTWRAAVEGVDAIFIVRPDHEEAPRWIAELVDLTPEQTHVVLLSELDQGYFSQDDWALRTERVVRESGRTWTIVRPNWFMQVFTDPRFYLDDLRENGRLALPSGGQPVSWIDARDIAAVAAVALVDETYRGQVLDLTGPEALSLPRTAELLAGALARPVEHVEVSMEEALAGSEGFTRDNDEGAFERIRLGQAAVVTDTVLRVTGSPARTFEQFLAEDPTFAREVIMRR